MYHYIYSIRYLSIYKNDDANEKNEKDEEDKNSDEENRKAEKIKKNEKTKNNNEYWSRINFQSAMSLQIETRRLN